MSVDEAERRHDPVSVVYRTAPGVDAIDQHSRHMVAALNAAGIDAAYVASGVRHHDLPTGSVILQYQPFSYGRWGFAPGLIEAARRARRRGDVRLTLMVHEAWVTMLDWRSSLMGAWQRMQLRALVHLADCVMTSTEALARDLGHAAVHVPVPANVVPVDSSPHAARARLGLDAKLAVGLFGRAHESRALDHAEAAIAALAPAVGTDHLAIINLGADAPAVSVPAGVEVRSPGTLAPDRLSLHLWACDLVLLPFTDGVSTRRSTLMAALAHGCPVVGSLGHNTDTVLAAANEALVLTPVGDRRAFADVAAALAVDPARRLAIGETGRRLYQERFDWPVLARTIARLIGEPPPRRATGPVPVAP
ncbi:MAG: glycosyltransferase [Solirubrobacterales bacterium]|nr:glycosyltransferase [Solirubrobacterales bacterium]